MASRISGGMLLVITILYGTAIAFIWWGSSWKVALGAFLLIWAANTERIVLAKTRV